MIVVQYNCHNQNLIYTEAQLFEMDKTGKMVRIIINGKEFTNKDLIRFLYEGFVWFISFDNPMPTREDLRSLIKEWDNAYKNIYSKKI